MFCVVAAEAEASQKIADNLSNSGLYPGWRWAVCGNAGELEKLKAKRPDVLVVSRFFPCSDPIGLLKSLRMTFPSSRIVLLAGTPGEQQRAYIKAAQRFGLLDIVTGKLPGDRPYTIFEALKTPKDPELDGFIEESEPLVVEERTPPVRFVEEPEPPAPAPVIEEKAQAGAIEEVRKAVKKAVGNASGEEGLQDTLTKLLSLLEGNGRGEEAPPAMQKTGAGRKGILVLTAANKGGVGKTTVATTLAVALSRAGVPTVLMDCDIGAPGVANLLGIKDVPGLETLAERPVRENALHDLIVKKDALDVFPGPMTGTFPNIQRDQLAKIAETLAEMYAVVVADTAPEYWTKPWLTSLFARADRVLAVVDQSVLSEKDTQSYAPYLLSVGVKPEKISIVLNKYSPRLHNPRTVEKIFCMGFKKEIKALPRVAAVIPEDWNTYVGRGYKNEVAGLEDVNSGWHKLAEDVALMAGYSYETKAPKGGVMGKLLGGLKKK